MDSCARFYEQCSLLEEKINKLIKKARDLKHKNLALEQIQATFVHDQNLYEPEACETQS